METHNPIGPHAIITAWEDDSLTLYDSTQYVLGVRRTVAKALGLSSSKFRMVRSFVGGGFGYKGPMWSHVVLAAVAACQAGRPIELVPERPQMFDPVGGYPRTKQRIVLGTGPDGRFTTISHDLPTTTSMIEDWTESCIVVIRMFYGMPHQQTMHRLVHLNTGTPTLMWAPGEATDTFTLEATSDEMVYTPGIGPVELCLCNDVVQDPEKRLPWSDKSLTTCHCVGAECPGWARRNPQPGSVHQSSTRVGWGVTTVMYLVNRSATAATARCLPDGTVQAESGSQGLGTGTCMVMAQVATDAMGVPVDHMHFSLGGTRTPEVSMSGGSQSVASVSPAVRATGMQAHGVLIAVAVADASSPPRGLVADEVTTTNGFLSVRSGAYESVTAVVARYSRPIEVTAKVQPGEEKQKFSMYSFGAVLVEVHIDADPGVVRVSRIIGNYGVGWSLNARVNHSQLMGGTVWGIDMALFEEGLLDSCYGCIISNNLAEYHVPVSADIPDIDILVPDEADPHISPLDVEGIDKTGITGVPTAIANVAYHATDRRMCELPITLDELI